MLISCEETTTGHHLHRHIPCHLAIADPYLHRTTFSMLSHYTSLRESLLDKTKPILSTLSVSYLNSVAEQADTVISVIPNAYCRLGSLKDW